VHAGLGQILHQVSTDQCTNLMFSSFEDRLHIRLSCVCRAGADLASSFHSPMHKPDVERF